MIWSYGFIIFKPNDFPEFVKNDFFIKLYWCIYSNELSVTDPLISSSSKLLFFFKFTLPNYLIKFLLFLLLGLFYLLQ
jgi:hypothetical protein